MKISEFAGKNRAFLFILLSAVVFRLLLMFRHTALWWDSGVYVGMGKFIFSFGATGLWEHIRPVLWSFLLGFFWRIGADSLISGRILTLFFSVASIYVFYLLACEISGKRTAVFASVIFSFSSVFVLLSSQLYTEIPAVFFVLSSAYFLSKKKHFVSGFFVGLAFLTKFPAALFVTVAVAFLFFRREWKQCTLLIIGFSIPALLFFAVNQIFYGDPFLPFLDANDTILKVAGCNELNFKPAYYYFKAVIIDNPLHIFSILGIAGAFMKKEKKYIIPLIFLALPFAYFTQLHCRDYRYILLFIPFLTIFSAKGISMLAGTKKHFVPVLSAIILISASVSAEVFFDSTWRMTDNEKEYIMFFSDKNPEGEVWVSHPLAAVYTDIRLEKAYYPVFGSDVAGELTSYIAENKEGISYISFDSCGGGLICPSNDMHCAERFEKLLGEAEENFETVYNRTNGWCWYIIYKNRNSTS